MRSMIVSVENLLADSFIRQKMQRNSLPNHESHLHLNGLLLPVETLKEKHNGSLSSRNVSWELT